MGKWRYSRVVIQLSILGMAFAFVIWLIFLMRQPSTLNFFEQLLGGGSSKSWCPDQIAGMVTLKDQVNQNGAWIDDTCHLPTDYFSQDDLRSARWQAVMDIRLAQGRMQVLEADLEKGLFRLGDLPFASRALRDRLDFSGQPH